MKKITMLLSLTCLINSNIFGQETRLKPFVLEGTIALDSGTVMLRMIADSSFYNKSARNLTSKIEAGKFRIEGEIPHPMAFMIDVEGKYYSDIVLINPTEQSVNCNIDAKKEKLFVDDQSRAEYETYTATFKAYRIKDSISYAKRKALEDLYKSGLPDSIKAGLDAETDSLYEESDRMLLSFVKNNPVSYLGLWITNRLSNWGYEKILDDIYTGFADPIRYSFAGKILNAKLTDAGKLALGKPFPSMNLLDRNSNKSGGLSIGNNKYTLVDFWYTDCNPCRAQFPSFKNTYKKFHQSGFELVGISTDKEKYKKELPKVIKELKLDWVHFWDINGNEATALSILAFPTNFLLDQHGTIIQKNISPAELAIFLQKNL